MGKLPLNTILQGHVLDISPALPTESVNCVVTSPPYWAKRAYHTTPMIWGGKSNCGHRWGNEKVTDRGSVERNSRRSTLSMSRDRLKSQSFIPDTDPISRGRFCLNCSAWLGELGSEPTIDLYIQHLCDIFDEVKRILRKDGVLWVVIGDTMSGSGLPKKCQCMVPERFSLEMINRGWIRHSTCIWHKTNPKPESVNTRFTNDFEYIYMFVKSNKIFFDTQYEPAVSIDDRRLGKGRLEYNGKCLGAEGTGERAFVKVEKYRRMRTTFTLPLQPYIGAHFAVFPERLIEPLIRATCPLAVCSKCGTPRREICENTKIRRKRLHDRTNRGAGNGSSPNDYAGIERKFVSYDFCSCGAPLRRGVVFDPFMGVGTTAVVAERLKRDWIGIELGKSYIKMAYRRLRK